MRNLVQRLRLFGVIVSLGVFTSCSAVGRQLPTTAAYHTPVVLLGTGTPRADPQRSGPATAIVVDDTPYLVDAGPGIVRRAAAAYDKGIKGLAVARRHAHTRCGLELRLHHRLLPARGASRSLR